MAHARLNPALPNGTDRNCLEAAAAAIVEDPDTMRLAVIVVDTKSLVQDRDSGDTTVRLRIRRVELVTDRDDVVKVQQIVLAAHAARTGGEILPFNTDDDGQRFADWANAAADDEESGAYDE